jgi:hypothetical protein
VTEPARDEDRAPARGRLRADRPWLVIAAWVVLVGLVAWRSTLGMSFMDDGYYAAATVRLAQGARLFADEMFVQSLGFLAAVPFAKLWTLLFGTTGVVVALRLFYVAVATAAATATYRLLRPSFARWSCFAASAVVFMAPAYSLFAVTYDTMAAAGMLLACVLVFASVRDSKPWLAVAAGAAAAFAAVSYPPLAVASIALLATLAFRTRDRRLIGAMALGAAAVVVVFAVWLLSRTSLAEIRIAFEFAVGGWAHKSGPSTGTRVLGDLWALILVLGRTWVVPLWVWFTPAVLIGLGAAQAHWRVPRHARARGIALACLPLALALPVIANKLAFGADITAGTLGGNYLIAFTACVAMPMFAGVRGGRSAVRDLALYALPAGLVGFVLVVASSAASIYWASGIVGLAPIVVAAVLWWAGEVADTLGRPAGVAASALLVVAVLGLLFSTAFKDDAPLTLRYTIRSGAYAGITTDSGHASQVAELMGLGAKWVGPDTRVTVAGVPAGYLLTGGVPLTNVIWLDPGPSDVFTVDYLTRVGRWPDVVFAPLPAVKGPPSADADPFLSAVIARYQQVDVGPASGIAVFASSGTRPRTP